jgi:4-nitrophenyl phosphatase
MILDMDGVLWRDTQPIGNLPVIFRRLDANNIRVVLATNNSTRTVQQYQEKARGFGVNLEPWQIVTSSQAAAQYLAKPYPEGGCVYVVGEQALVDTLQEAGFTFGKDDPVAVVAGLDRNLTYDKLRNATRFIRAGAWFLATNSDRTLPTPEGLVPGAGAVLAAIQAATDVHPIIAGKPSPAMYEIALKRLGTSPQETIIVGDRIETDIIGGQQIGCLTSLVLSGVTDKSSAQTWRPAPDIIAADLETVVEMVIS